MSPLVIRLNKRTYQNLLKLAQRNKMTLSKYLDSLTEETVKAINDVYGQD